MGNIRDKHKVSSTFSLSSTVVKEKDPWCEWTFMYLIVVESKIYTMHRQPPDVTLHGSKFIKKNTHTV